MGCRFYDGVIFCYLVFSGFIAEVFAALAALPVFNAAGLLTGGFLCLKMSQLMYTGKIRFVSHFDQHSAVGAVSVAAVALRGLR